MNFHSPYPSTGNPEQILAWHSIQRDGLMHLARQHKAGEGFASYDISIREQLVWSARWHNWCRIRQRRKLQRFMAPAPEPVTGLQQASLFGGEVGVA